MSVGGNNTHISVINLQNDTFLQIGNLQTVLISITIQDYCFKYWEMTILSSSSLLQQLTYFCRLKGNQHFCKIMVLLLLVKFVLFINIKIRRVSPTYNYLSPIFKKWRMFRNRTFEIYYIYIYEKNRNQIKSLRGAECVS